MASNPTVGLVPANDDELKIEGNPTKELFITMLVKDITLRDAIGDLVDNSVDAAKKNSESEENLTAFEIHITATKDLFHIKDNCGGLEVDVARKSAFCFGKPADYKIGKHTIGQFGIGMKRAFFKLGSFIEVGSVASKSNFKMHIDVNKWSPEKDWDFRFDELNENLENTLDKTGTDIRITQLNDDPKEQFSDSQFIMDLKSEIALEHVFSLNKGLKIIVNDEHLPVPSITLIEDSDKGIEPVYWKHFFKKGLNAEIFAGIAEDNGEAGGWYIFCNERMILGPDTTDKTGWRGGGKELPKFHDQYFRFRGYVFFNAEDSSKLPWNTTKTGMNMDSPEFIKVREQMIIIGKQVKKIMDDMKKEREKGNPINQRHLNIAVEQAKVVPVSLVIQHKASLPSVYKYPEHLLNPAKKNASDVRITFTKPAQQVKKVKAYFKTDDNDSAGELAFNYFYENEIE